jgi:signal transduction histidine kinase/CheY-like chemotaxis protein
MGIPSDQLSEPNRLRVLHQTRLLDQPAEDAFDRLTRLAARLLSVPIALVSLVDKDRQFFVSQVGLPEELAAARQTPNSHSFCKYVALSGQPLVVSDAREHPILKDNPVIGYGVVAYAGVPLITREGLVLGSFCAIDTTPRDWTASQIDDLHDFAAIVMTEIELRRANEAKDRFIAMLSHELRTPLSPALLTAIEMIGDPSLPERFRDEVRLIHRNIELETRMIDALLDLTRINSGKLHLTEGDVDLHAVLRASVAASSFQARAKSIDVQLALEAARYQVKGDAAKLQQVFCNLLSNGIKFSPVGGQIVLRTSDAGPGSVKVEVSDSGVGISVEVLPRIFDSFEQGGRQVTREFGGLGLGLAICKGILDAHQGSIAASSEGLGRGTTMTVVLQNAVAPQGVKPVAESEPVRAGSGMSILLVEDHEDTLRAMSRLLRKTEHQVITANCVSQAIAAAANQKFDLIISDIGLPDGTGLELLEQLGKNRPRWGIALTGYGMEEDIRKSESAGFQKHLTKPINFSELQTAIAEIAG